MEGQHGEVTELKCRLIPGMQSRQVVPRRLTASYSINTNQCPSIPCILIKRHPELMPPVAFAASFPGM